MSDKTTIGFAPAEAITPTALRPFRADTRLVRSELPGVAHEAWTDFVFVMKTQNLEDVSASNGLGMFDLRFKRLADFGLVSNIRYRQDNASKRSVQVADWVIDPEAWRRIGVETPPGTQKAFLRSAEAQYKLFTHSMRDYFERMAGKEIAQPKGVSVSGALAVLHKGGRAALAKWGDSRQRFPATEALFRAANGVF